MVHIIGSLDWQLIVEVGLGVFAGLCAFRAVEWVAWRRVGVRLQIEQ